jgi:hemerythrin-like metal-binding protein
MGNSSLSYLPNALVIDVPEIDDQHARLFEQLEAFKASCIDHNAFVPEEAEAIFQTLVDHCATEERLAGEAGLDFGRHGDKHRLMLSGIRKRLDAMEHPDADVYGLIRYVAYWFERHITEEDKHLGNQLHQSAEAEARKHALTVC